MPNISRALSTKDTYKLYARMPEIGWFSKNILLF